MTSPIFTRTSQTADYVWGGDPGVTPPNGEDFGYYLASDCKQVSDAATRVRLRAVSKREAATIRHRYHRELHQAQEERREETERMKAAGLGDDKIAVELFRMGWTMPPAFIWDHLDMMVVSVLGPNAPDRQAYIDNLDEPQAALLMTEGMRLSLGEGPDGTPKSG